MNWSSFFYNQDLNDDGVGELGEMFPCSMIFICQSELLG